MTGKGGRELWGEVGVMGRTNIREEEEREEERKEGRQEENKGGN